MKGHYDVAIIGSGFAGSILARILAKYGRRVLMLDAAQHPRFAIGESSTPIADLMLRRIGETYGLDDLVDLSSYGPWRTRFPQLPCGIKRGFSYFDHRHRDGDNRETEIGDRSLIVAASPDDPSSDTHWYRPTLDRHLFQAARDCGVECHELTRVTHVGARDDATLSIRCDGHPAVTCGDVVDASGSAAVTRNFFANADWTDRLRTRTCAAFAHFRDVASYSQLENQRHGDRRASLPFDADDAAQHHLVDDGWLWMLRMNNGVTSVGMTSPIPGDAAEVEVARRRTNCVDVLASKCQRYPRLAAVLNAACVVDPPGGIVSLPRVQRWLDPVARPHCFLLPTTAFTLDPLHSTGIAHALAGVDRLVDLLLAGGDERRVREYRDGLIAEADHLDRLIALAYDAMPRFDRFVAACMLYFAAAIGCEERIAAGAVPGRLWLADDDGFVKLVRDCRDQFAAVQDDRLLIDGLRRRLAPWNTAGLLDESLHNRYAYTATK